MPHNRAFHDWFRGSKVVDKNRKPLIVYHGTSRGGFTAFDLGEIDKHHAGFFFTSNKGMAATYSGEEVDDPYLKQDAPVIRTGVDLRRFINSTDNDIHGWRMQLYETQQILGDDDRAWITRTWFLEWQKGKQCREISAHEYFEHGQPDFRQLVRDASAAVARGPERGGLYAVYLRIVNPLRVNGRGAPWNHIPFEGGYWKTTDLEVMAKKRGYDGVVIRNIYDSFFTQKDAGDVYIVFDPRQVKSAVWNRGTYDSNDPDIRH